MVDLTATTVVSEAQSQRRSQIWIDQILTTLHQNHHQAVTFIDHSIISRKIHIIVYHPKS